MKYEYVFWDWNGTLFDDARTAWRAVNEMLTERKLNTISFEQYREYVDVPIIKFYERVMDMSEENIDELSDEFHSLCQRLMPESPLAEGVKELLCKLSERGIKQYIFSSSKTEIIVPYIKRLGIEQYFLKVLGANDSYAGSKAERTRDFLLANSIPPEKSVFIGDLVHDSETARLIGADCILVSYGHQCERELIRTGRNVASSVSSLAKLLNISL